MQIENALAFKNYRSTQTRFIFAKFPTQTSAHKRKIVCTATCLGCGQKGHNAHTV